MRKNNNISHIQTQIISVESKFKLPHRGARAASSFALFAYKLQIHATSPHSAGVTHAPRAPPTLARIKYSSAPHVTQHGNFPSFAL
jgi:hypothetical protein